MRVWVTRDEKPDGPLSSALSAAGLTPVLEPVLARRIVDGAGGAIERLAPDDWLVLTSVYAIEAVDAQAARVPNVAVVGEPSRRAAEALGCRVKLVSGRGDGRSLFDELRRTVSAGVVCYPRSSLAKPPKPWAGVQLISPVLYKTTPRIFDRTVVERIDVIAATSPSAVEVVGVVERRFASIGPTTSDAIRRLGAEPAIEAAQPSFDSLAAAIAGWRTPEA